MPRKPFRTNSEEIYADHLGEIGLEFEYERKWGLYKPDFTILDKQDTEKIIAIADVKDLEHSAEQKALLAQGKMVSIHRDPSLRTRRRIHEVWKQFQACTDYPCILMLSSGGDSLPEPLFVMSAMLGDYTITFNIPSGSGKTKPEVSPFFGANGKMVDDEGNPMNSRISAVGLMSSVRPDEAYSGFINKVHEYGDLYLGKDNGDEGTDKYLAACEKLRKKLTSQGYDLDSFATQVEYVVNPLATHPFPKKELANRYVKVWEYSIQRQKLELTHDWSALPRL